MKHARSRTSLFGAIAALVMGGMTLTGCETNAQTGALFGATFGALAGNAFGSHGRHGRHGSNGSGALIGAAIGGGLGYAIGNEEDKRQHGGYTYYSPRVSYSAPARVHTTRVITTHEPVCVERRVYKPYKPKVKVHEPVVSHNPFVGTSWQVVSVTGDQARRPRIASAVITFVDRKQVVAVRTLKSGRAESLIDGYRVVGDTLLLELDGVLINARYVLDGDRLVLVGKGFSAVLERV